MAVGILNRLRKQYRNLPSSVYNATMGVCGIAKNVGMAMDVFKVICLCVYLRLFVFVYFQGDLSVCVFKVICLCVSFQGDL